MKVWNKILLFSIVWLLIVVITSSNSLATTTVSLLDNGDFSEGLKAWDEIREAKTGIITIGIIEDSPQYPNVLGYKRKVANRIRGKLGVSQSLNKDVSEVKSLILKVEIKILHSSIQSDGLYGGVYPLTIELEYLDEQNLIKSWRHGFLYTKRVKYKDIGQVIPKDKWYSYTSGNLMLLVPKPKVISKVKIYGDGWEFGARVTNIQLLGETKQEEISIPKEEGLEEPVKEKPPKEEEKEVLKEKVVSESESLITNTFVDIDIRQALREIAAQAQITIIPDETVQGVISMELNNLPLEKALKRILTIGGYIFTKIEDYYLVGSPDPGNPTFPLFSTIKRVKLNYLKVENISNLLPEFYSKFIKIDKGENILIINAPVEMIERIEEYIRKADISPKQVLIEALITELSSEARKSLGTDWSFEGGKSKITLMPNTLELKGNYVGVGVSSQVMATLKILAETGKANIRANPRILTIDGKSATIYIGREEYCSIPGTAYQPGRFDKILSGITLKITPYIGNNDEITVAIEPEVSDVSGIGKEGYPVISKRSANTTIRVKNGQTISIGGLVRQKEEKRTSQIPIIGRIPLLSFFFRNIHDAITETEIVIFITPHIVE